MKRHAPAAERNRDPILEVLRRVLPETGTVLEIACGTGQHAVHFAGELPRLRWQPTDPSPEAVSSAAAWRAEVGLPNLLAPRQLDARDPSWPAADAVFCANMVHISPWESAVGLLAGAGRVLAPGAPLVTYGPYRFAGRFTAESNAAFDASLRGRDPSWGVRDVDDLAAEAARHGLALDETVDMPANNHVLVWRRRAP